MTTTVFAADSALRDGGGALLASTGCWGRCCCSPRQGKFGAGLWGCCCPHHGQLKNWAWAGVATIRNRAARRTCAAIASAGPANRQANAAVCIFCPPVPNIRLEPTPLPLIV